MANKDSVVKHTPQPINGQPSGLKLPKNSKKKQPQTNDLLTKVIISAGICFVFFLICFIAWFLIQLTPVGSDPSYLKRINIPSSSSSTQIGRELEKQGLIRSAAAFDIYVRLSGKGSVLRAGNYRLSPAEGTAQIVEHFIKGSNDEFKITFYPGATLTDISTTNSQKKLDVTSVLKRAGFTDSEIQSALADVYDSPLFDGKPADSDLEGYVYGETYNFNDGASAEAVLRATFKEFYVQIQKNNLITGFQAHHLNLYEAITLASIIQREANTPSDQRQVAAVFYNRLKIGMVLGSDVTYQYIADKTGVARNPNLDSPYNTRRFPGLPPGPIASPGLSALQAVANPASSDYLFFLAGDDGALHFARTSAEHESNITRYCKVGCTTP